MAKKKAALAPRNCSELGFCMTCLHWEPRDSMKERGYEGSTALGFCEVFLKLTEATHGLKCTAIKPNADVEARDQ